MSTSVRVPSCSLAGTTKLTRCRGATPIPANRNFKPSKGFNSHHTLRRAAQKSGKGDLTASQVQTEARVAVVSLQERLLERDTLSHGFDGFSGTVQPRQRYSNHFQRGSLATLDLSIGGEFPA